MREVEQEGEAERQSHWVICFWPGFLEISPDEWIGWVGRWIDGRMTGKKKLRPGCSFSVCLEAEGWTER